jgi:5-methylcytosine-specific restriction protein A
MPLSKQQRDALEDAALRALTGSLDDLVNGFRIQTSAGQVAAVYWGDLAPGNEVEIALAPARLTDKYDLPTTQAWVSAVKTRYPAPCNVHKHGSDWPIFGLQYGEALALLSDCQKLRKGVMSGVQEAEIARWRASQSPEESTAAGLAAELEALRPRQQHAVIDLVRRAGVSVDRWFVKADRTPAVSPRSNPAYCYNWSFGGVQEPAVACLWHASMKVLNGSIQFQGNLRGLVTKLEEIARDPTRPVEHRERARPQAARARQLDDLIRGCATAGREVRVVVNEGDMRDESSLGEDSSFVRVRLLDPVPWTVASYDPITGECRLQRKATNAGRADRAPPAVLAPPRFADQHDLLGSDFPERVPSTGESARRDGAVRLAVLHRSDGRCELCDAEGFRMADGRVYAETHHVQPLAQKGADRVWNVVALCPNHHREAHYGSRRDEIKAKLLQLLATMYPLQACGQAAQAD